MSNTKDDYISREAAKSKKVYSNERHEYVVPVADLDWLSTADVVEVHAVIDRMNKERKRAKGNWHTDPYWLGWVDAMRRAQRIVDGTIDDEPMYGPSDDVCKRWPVYALNNEEDMREDNQE